MAYATADDMIARYGQDELADATPSLDVARGTLDTARLALLLADASSLMDSYLQRRYEVPVRPVSPALVRCCCALARYDLALGGGNVPSEQIRNGRSGALSWLRDIGDGRATLDATVIGESTDGWSRVATRPCAIGRSDLP